MTKNETTNQSETLHTIKPMAPNPTAIKKRRKNKKK